MWMQIHMLYTVYSKTDKIVIIIAEIFQNFTHNKIYECITWIISLTNIIPKNLRLFPYFRHFISHTTEQKRHQLVMIRIPVW